jgi:hypothetical protein
MPIVGVIISVCLILYIHNTIYTIGNRLILSIDDISEVQNQILIIEKNCKNIDKSMKHCMFLIFPVIGVMNAIQIFDVLGDFDGYKKSTWSFFLMLFMPLLLWLLLKMYKGIMKKLMKNSKNIDLKLNLLKELNDENNGNDSKFNRVDSFIEMKNSSDLYDLKN